MNLCFLQKLPIGCAQTGILYEASLSVAEPGLKLKSECNKKPLEAQTEFLGLCVGQAGQHKLGIADTLHYATLRRARCDTPLIISGVTGVCGLYGPCTYCVKMRYDAVYCSSKLSSHLHSK